MAELYDPRTTPWLIDESEFHEIEDPGEQKEFLLRYAVLAPSGHNSQPWTFRISGNGIEVAADPSRRLPVCDPADRELLISIGASITNLRVAAAHFGFDTTVLYETPAGLDGTLAVVSLRETCDPDAGLRALFGAITKRHTMRAEFSRREIDTETLSRVCDLVESSELLRFIVPHERAKTGELVEEANRRLMRDERYRNELADWVRPNDTDAGDGMTGDAFGIPGPLSAFAPWVIRRFDVGDERGLRDRQAVTGAAGLIVLTADDTSVALIRAGEALERLLLALTSLGVQYAFVNQPIEVPELRRELWSLIRSAAPPQLLLRIGYTTAAQKPMPRRRVSEVTG
jgi:hypothetical protein